MTFTEIISFKKKTYTHTAHSISLSIFYDLPESADPYGVPGQLLSYLI